ncbi:Protein of unknown function [Friedmanniella luteola]|uniref:DUF2000 domain-containing protein n=1 Tax=Friedmanniella luteola TaxID=546871 RepID=A0A1H1V0R0_9ACTN|nr:DUF2000 domain-containing protein [Friedmanniella luteola]SDS78315.1 Protein of unknown function [Friedmanniella luteola]
MNRTRVQDEAQPPDGEQDPGARVGFGPDEVDTASPTRAARLEWVVVVDEELPAGRAVNAAVCAAAATGVGVEGLLGPDAVDADGSRHRGLPWAGCTVLGASGERLLALRARAVAADGVFVADMPHAAQSTRVYDEYRAVVAASTGGELDLAAVSLVGPRNRVDRLVKGLALLA